MNAKILVADESPTIHKIVAMAFEEEGITVEGISRGEHALEYMVKYQPNIVLADIHLPGTDGYELCRQIKNSPTFGNIRVILLTSDFEDIDQVELEISRADDFISKPFKTEEILNKVKSQLNLPVLNNVDPQEKTEPPPDPENLEIIQNEFEDIVSQSKETTSDTVKQLFAEGEGLHPSINQIDLESDAPSQPNNEDSGEVFLAATESTEKESVDPKINEAPQEIVSDAPEETPHAETRPVEVKTGDLNSAFQSVLSSPASEPEDRPKPEPGSKPDLIEETLSFMANQHLEEEFDFDATPEPVIGETSPSSSAPADNSLGNKIIREHIDQVMDQLPEDARNGNSPAALEKSVREVLGEIAPKIIRKVIQEEIESLKKMKEA